MNSSSQPTIVAGNPYLEFNNHGQTIKIELTKEFHRLGRDRYRSDLIIPEDWLIISGCHATLRKLDNTYCIYDGDEQRPSTNGLFIDNTRITIEEGYMLQAGSEIKIGLDPKTQIFCKYVDPLQAIATINPPVIKKISLTNFPIVLGRDEQANFYLDSPLVSRRHASIDLDKKGNYIIHDHSKNGLFVNNQRVENQTVLQEGDRIKIGPFTLIKQGDCLELFDQGQQIRLDADRLFRKVKDQKGKWRVLLNDISLAIEPGQFVALVGGSGAGKSTLMRTLLGIDPTTKGKVYINGDDLRADFNIYRTQIGYVPQDDIIHRDLTVYEVLFYAAKLRLPPDININEIINNTLEQIEMLDQQDVLVSQLSGGQRKRVSIGVELLADPKLFFLDEPTSGLDPGLDKKMMQLLRKLANQGRTIILVTHATANIKMCDRIVFLGRGGRLCYFGPPQEALQFFDIKTDDFADIYNLLETGENAVQEWSNQFRQSEYYQRYVNNHLSVNQDNKLPNRNLPPTSKPISFQQQLAILNERYYKLILRDPVSLGLALFTAPIGIALIRLALRDQQPLIGEPEATLAPLALRVLFVFTSATLWVGLSTSLQEIVKEIPIYTRERLVNLRLSAYLSSKGLILSALAVMQTILMTLVILICFTDPKPELINWPLGVAITTFFTLTSCMGLGLFISALVKNSAQANSALPLVLLPQIIFSGVLFNMEGIASKFAWLMLSRWSVGAYGALVNVNGMVPEPTKLPDGSTVTLPFAGSPVYEATWHNLMTNWGALCLHTMIYLGLTFWLQKRKDIL